MQKIECFKYPAEFYRLVIFDEEKEVGRLFLYIIVNDSHDKPYGFIEDVWFNESDQGHGLATQLVQQAILKAKELHCRKIVGRFDREQFQGFYKKFGFKKLGIAFEMILNE